MFELSLVKFEAVRLLAFITSFNKLEVVFIVPKRIFELSLVKFEAVRLLELIVVWRIFEVDVKIVVVA